MKLTKDLKEAVRKIEEFPGITVVEVKRGKHFKFDCSTPTGRHTLVTSITPSDWRAWKNNETLLKRWSTT